MPVDLETLQHLPLLRGLATTEIEELAAHLEVTHNEAGVAIIGEGDQPGHPLFFLMQGSVEVIKRGMDGRGHVISSLSAPSVFGEIELFVQRPAIATVRSVTGVTLGLLRRGVFDEMCAANRTCALKVVRNLAQVLSYRLAAADDRLAAQFDLSAPGAGERIGQLRRVLYTDWQNKE